MNWYYKILGGHTHVRVFMNGGKCGDLVFRNEEFQSICEKAKCGLNNIVKIENEGNNEEDIT